jgi:hypothetical protein
MHLNFFECNDIYHMKLNHMTYLDLFGFFIFLVIKNPKKEILHINHHKYNTR